MRRRSSISGSLVLCISVFCALSARGQGIPSDQEYVVIGWNDLGMHCMNGDFSALCVLPPFNNLWVQVVKRGDPPQLMESGVSLAYRFPSNTTSADKVNFWDYEDQLFGVNLPLNAGLTGNGLAGTMPWNGHAFEATGIPLTPFEDGAPTVEQPYQLAEITLSDTPGGTILDQTTVVAPVSIEMHCDNCHAEGEDLAAPPKAAAADWSVVYDNILRQHDEEENTTLINQKPVLCADCHSSNALGAPGQPGVKSLSEAIHHKHGEEVSNINCYDCHPGAQTQCLRGAMYLAGKTCEDCHGSALQVASSIHNGRQPWIQEPRCETCHPDHAEEANTLYRNSVGHGGLYCAACHNSPHAILPTVQARDSLQMIRLQGHSHALSDCLVCHTAPPGEGGPHGLAMFNAVKAVNWARLK